MSHLSPIERSYRFDPAEIGPELLRARSGLELMEQLLAGGLPMAPMAATLDFRLVEVGPGRAVFEGEPGRFAYNLTRSVHGGWSAAILDSAMGCAVMSTLPQGRSYTTTELSIRYVRAIGETTGPLRAEGVVLHAGRRLATAEGRLIGADGKLYAHGQTSCLVFAVEDRV